MNLTISILGCEVFSISTETQASDDEPTATVGTLMPVGFTQMWQGHGNEEDR